MKTRWEFRFEYEDLRFERVYEYKVKITKEHAEAAGLPEQEFEAIVTIVPEKKDSTSIKNRGEINVFLPGRHETKDLAYSIANTLAHQITFSQGKLNIIWVFVVNELIPETSKEIEELGENRFGWEVVFEEVPNEVPFNSESLRKVIPNPLIKQFNITDNAQNTIDRFIGFFKILEDLYGSTPLKPEFIKPTKKKGNNKKQDLKPSLKSSDELIEIASNKLETVEKGVVRSISQNEIENLFDKFVDARHECAHLRSSKGFGITHGDARVKTEIEPLLEQLREVVYEAVQKHIAKIQS